MAVGVFALNLAVMGLVIGSTLVRGDQGGGLNRNVQFLDGVCFKSGENPAVVRSDSMPPGDEVSGLSVDAP